MWFNFLYRLKTTIDESKDPRKAYLETLLHISCVTLTTTLLYWTSCIPSKKTRATLPFSSNVELTASSGSNESRDDKLSLLLDDVDEEDDDDFVNRFVKLPYNDCGN